MKLIPNGKLAILALVAAGLTGCNAGLPVLDDAPAVATTAQPSPVAGGTTDAAPRPRVLFDSENDSFDAANPDALDYALSLTGTRYRYGGTSPREGFDCSGFVQYVFGHFGVELPRTARDIAESLPSVGRAELKPGDLVFFNTNGRTFSHVGIYIGDEKFVHAASSASKRVMVSDMNDDYWRKRLTGLRRPPAAALAVSVLGGDLQARL